MKRILVNKEVFFWMPVSLSFYFCRKHFRENIDKCTESCILAVFGLALSRLSRNVEIF